MSKARDPRLAGLADRIRSITDKYQSIAEAARAIGLPTNTLSRMRRAVSEPGVFDVVDFAARTGTSLDELFGLARSPIQSTKNDRTGNVRIKELSLKVAAGSGAIPDEIEVVAEFDFPVLFLDRLKVESFSNLHAVRALGDSMEPTIAKDALIMVDGGEAARAPPKPRSSKSRRRHAAIYVFYQRDAGYRVKRVEALDDNYFALISDNTLEFPPEIVRKSEIQWIVGKVVWWDNRL